SVKAFLHIRFFNVPAPTTGSTPIPVGLETLVYIFEPWFLRTIDLKEFNGVRSFLDPWVQKYPDADTVLQSIRKNLFTEEHNFIMKDVERALHDPNPDSSKKVLDALEIYLKNMGRESLVRAFPLALRPSSVVDSAREATQVSANL